MTNQAPPAPWTGNQTPYKPGDIANGHILGGDGRWNPLPPNGTLPPQRKKSVWGRWYMILAYALVGLMMIGAITSGGQEAAPAKDETVAANTEEAPKAQAPSEEQAEPKKAEPEKAEPEMTAGQENALGAAQNYLSFAPFSRKGLIEQLSSDAGDGYAHKDAVYAVNHVGANWNEQAAKAAKNYLDMTSFSRQGLIEQLSSDAGDGYTLKQATYGVNKAGL